MEEMDAVPFPAHLFGGEVDSLESPPHLIDQLSEHLPPVLLV